MGKLTDKNILITGGNSGIGLAAAQEFDREGARVAICGLNEGTLQAAKGTLGAGSLALRADVSKLADLDTMFATRSTAGSQPFRPWALELRRRESRPFLFEIPLPLVVGEFDVVGQGDARYAGVDQRKRLEVLRKLQRPAVGAPRAEIVRHHKQRCAKSIHERMKHLGHLVSMADPIEGDLFRFGPCIER